jgi:ectoine hydroxylase-related dioxygenase (phytanoyl-CoA dioxygenase family)
MFDSDYPLTQAQIDSYRRNGFVQLDDVVTGEHLKRIRDTVTAAVQAEVRDDRRAFHEKSSYEQIFIQKINLWDRHPELKEFVHSRRFANIAARLSGYQVRIFTDHALYKEPRTGAKTPWHQDTHYWPHQQKHHQLSLWLALSDATIQSGCMSFLPGTQLYDNIKPTDLKDPNASKKFRSPSRQTKAVCCPLKAGSCTFHNGLTFHYAGPNRTDSMREALAIIYMPDGTTYSGQGHRLDLTRFAIGDEFDGPLFPVLSDVPNLKRFESLEAVRQ